MSGVSRRAAVIALGATLRKCRHELRSTLEDWVLGGPKLKHPLPVFAGIELHQEPEGAPTGAL